MSPRRALLIPTVLIAALAAFAPAVPSSAQDPSDGSPYVLPTPTPTPTRTPTTEPGERPKLLSPMPVVRIQGKLTLRGASITKLLIKTPTLVRIVVTCRGRACPMKRWTAVAPDSTRRILTYRLRRFERRYPAGTVIEIEAVRRGTIGKYSRFTIRQGKPPRRADSCIEYGASKPQPCG